MRYSGNLIGLMCEMISSKGYYAFCQLSDEEIKSCKDIFIKDNQSIVFNKQMDSVVFIGKRVKCCHVLQYLFYDCVGYVSQQRCQTGNGG